MRRSLFAAPFALLLAACAAPVPVAENFPIMTQHVARTAKHWDVIARDVVEQTSGVIEANPQLRGRPVIVGTDYRTSAFNAAFRNFMTNHLVARGVTVQVCRAEQARTGSGFVMEGPQLEVQYEIQHVHHRARLPHYRPGALTALAIGVAVGRGLAVSHFDGMEASMLGIGLAALADVGIGATAHATQSEIIITTTIAEDNRYIFRRSDVYYVPDNDANLFLANYDRRSECGLVSVGADQNLRNIEFARERQFRESMRRVNLHWRD